MRKFLLAAVAGLIATSAAAAEPPACNDAGVQQTLARITEAHRIPFTRELGLAQNTRWCSSALFFAGGWQVTYTVELMDAATGRFWVQVRQRQACEFARNEGERHLIEDMGYRPVCQ